MEKTISTKYELLEKVEEFNKGLLDISGNALNVSGFKEWMGATTVTEEEVHQKTWWYYQEITKPGPSSFLIKTVITYDAFAYKGNEEEYYPLASVYHDLTCSKEMGEYFMQLYLTSSGFNWSTRFDNMVWKLKEELGLPTERNQPWEVENTCGSKCIDPDDFFDSI